VKDGRLIRHPGQKNGSFWPRVDLPTTWKCGKNISRRRTSVELDGIQSRGYRGRHSGGVKIGRQRRSDGGCLVGSIFASARTKNLFFMLGRSADTRADYRQICWTALRVNESAPYIDVVHSMYTKHSEGAAQYSGIFLFDQPLPGIISFWVVSSPCCHSEALLRKWLCLSSCHIVVPGPPDRR